MEGSHATEGSQRLCCTERGAPSDAEIGKRLRLMEGLSLRPKGAAALLHRRGESPLRLNARRGLTRRKKGSHYNRREPAALLHREWEPRPPPSTQRNSKWQTEASHCDRREPWVCCTGRGAPSDAEEAKRRDWWRDSHCVRRELRLCCTGGESPPCGLECKARFDASEEGLPLQPKGASGSAAPGVGAPSATKRAAQPGMTDGGVTLRPEGAVGLLHRKGSPVRRWDSKETRLMEGANWSGLNVLPLCGVGCT